MIDRLIEFSLTQRLLVLGLTLLLIGAGIQAWRSLPIDAFPDISTTQVKIILKAPGMTPEEVEKRVAAPVETEMLGIPNQRILRSLSKYGLTDITVDFDDSVDIYWARTQVAERLNSVLADLPEDVTGGLAPIATPLADVHMFTIEGDTLDLSERRALLDWVIRPQLRTLPGVADVNSLGGFVRTFEVAPDNAAMLARSVTLDELAEAIETGNRNDGAGLLVDGEEAWLLRVEGAVQTLEDLASIVIKNVDGVPVRVGDVSDVRIGSLTRYGGVTYNGIGETVQGLVIALRGANAQQVTSAVEARLAEIAPTLPEGITLNTFYDRADLIEHAVGTVSEALLQAIVLVLVLLFLFLGNARAALTVALTLPLAALATFLLMRQMELSANLMSLGGLAIAIGLLVDGAVVVVENVVTHLVHDQSRQGRLHQIYRAVSEVGTPVVAGVLIIMIVFMPLLTLEGIEGKLFVPVALTIVFALGAALLLSLTVVPVIASWLLKDGAQEEPWLLRQAVRLYTPILDSALTRPRPVLIAAVLMLAFAAVLFPFIGKSFMPVLDEGDLVLQLEKLPSISLEESMEIDIKMERAIMERVPEVLGAVWRMGSDELGLDPMGFDESDGFLTLKPRSEWRKRDKEWLTNEIRQVLNDFPGVDFAFTQPIDMRVSEMLTGSRGDLAVKVFGSEIEPLNRLADQVEDIISSVAGAQDVMSKKNEGVQYLQATVDRMATGRHGLTVNEVAGFLKGHLEGVELGIIQEGMQRTPVVLRADEDLRMSPTLFERLRIPTADGRGIPLTDVVKLERTEGPVLIERENAARYVTVQSNVAGRDLVGFVDEVRSRISTELALPDGYYVVYAGEFENQQRAAARLSIVVPVSLALIFALLFTTFRSAGQAVLILANIPFALVGGVAALFISGEYLSVPASVGFIALLGIAVLNGVVMVDYFNQLAARGLPATAVVRDGALRRLRPVLMTASITAFALVPLLLATGPGSEIQKPLAIVVIGGLVTSTALTLVILPVLYRHFILRGRVQ